MNQQAKETKSINQKLLIFEKTPMKAYKHTLSFLLVFLTGRVSVREINMSLDAGIFDRAGTVNCRRMGDANRSRLKETGLTKTQLHNWLISDECRTAIGNLGIDKINQLLNVNLPPNTPANILSNSIIDYLDNTSNFNQIFKF